ncbi:hypothetical protein pSal_SNUABM02_030 [Salmonella phage pSal-SNUABM-02]|nr:hypothetical protein pSal_SNUABM02_030 [Salmonella phage pSal-SNUABM-02]
MDELFALVLSLTFLLSLIVSSLVMVLVWIAIPDIKNHKVLIAVMIIGLSASLTLHYSKQEYNPDKHYKTLAERYHDFRTSESQGK